MSRPATAGSTLSMRMLARTFALCRRQGHDPSALFVRAGVPPSLLDDPDARVPYAVVAQLSEAVFQLTGDENFGLHLAGDVQNVGEFDAGMLLLMASESVRVALRRMVEHQRYWGDGPRVTAWPRPGGLAFSSRSLLTLSLRESAGFRHGEQTLRSQ